MFSNDEHRDSRGWPLYTHCQHRCVISRNGGKCCATCDVHHDVRRFARHLLVTLAVHKCYPLPDFLVYRDGVTDQRNTADHENSPATSLSVLRKRLLFSAFFALSLSFSLFSPLFPARVFQRLIRIHPTQLYKLYDRCGRPGYPSFTRVV